MDISERKQAEEQNRLLTRRLLNAQEEERKRIARDLHDELGQALSTLQFGMNALKEAFPPKAENQKEKYGTVITQIEHVGDTVRRISSELRPEILDQLGLFPALEWYIKGFKERNEGIAVDFQFIGFKKRLSPEIEIVLYRVLQEALANIAKHAMASNVSVNITFSYPNVIFTIKDDGVGFDAELTRMTKDGGVGLLGMRERIDSVGGLIEIRSGPGKGTLIRTKLSVLKGRDSDEQDKCFGSR